MLKNNKNVMKVTILKIAAFLLEFEYFVQRFRKFIYSIEITCENNNHAKYLFIHVCATCHVISVFIPELSAADHNTLADILT